MIRVAVVDDEQPARERLSRLLASFPDVAVVGEAANGPDAIETILKLRPHAVFLDIEMPGASGIDVTRSLPEPRPRVVFCTAYDRYAVDAFDTNATDYPSEARDAGPTRRGGA
jgi:two-component system LytT family response regulator